MSSQVVAFDVTIACGEEGVQREVTALRDQMRDTDGAPRWNRFRERNAHDSFAARLTDDFRKYRDRNSGTDEALYRKNVIGGKREFVAGSRLGRTPPTCSVGSRSLHGVRRKAVRALRVGRRALVSRANRSQRR